MKKLTRQTILSLLAFLAMFAVIVWLCVQLAPLLVEVFRNVGDESELSSYLNTYGARAVPVLVGLSALQVIFLSVIPAAGVQLLAGLCYGVWLGALICLMGLVLGNAVIFLAVRRFGAAFQPFFHRRQRADKKSKLFSLETLRNLPNPERIAFFLYLIPGIPDGILPYLFAQTRISFPRYLLAVLLASIPSMVLFTLIGARLSAGDTASSLVLLCVFLLALLAVVLFRKRIWQWLERGAHRQEHPLA